MSEPQVDPPPPMVGAEAVVAAAVRRAVQPTWVAGPDGRVRHANGFALAALGDELVGRAAGDVGPSVPPPTAQAVVRDLDRFVRDDGSHARVAFAAVPIDLPDGRGVVVAFTDMIEADDDALRELAPPRRASLRRVASGIAHRAAAVRAFATVATEIGRMLGVDLLHIIRREPGEGARVIGAWAADGAPDTAACIRSRLADLPRGAELVRTHTLQREDAIDPGAGPMHAALHADGIGCVVCAPIVLEGEIWGALLAGRRDGAGMPAGIEGRLAEFADLVGTRVSSMVARRELSRLADQQAALRRVATLVARDVPADELFATVTRELGLLLDVDLAHMSRYEDDGTAAGVATWSLRGDPIPLTMRAPDDGINVASRVYRTGRSARRADYEPDPSVAAGFLRDRGVETRIAAPIVVGGDLWGVMIVAVTDDARLPADVEPRMADFSELVATAIANSEARAERARLADEQEALRHIATLVARDVPAATLFSEVAGTVGRLLEADLSGMIRYEGDDVITPVATWAKDGEHPPVTGRWPLRPGDLGSTIQEKGEPARVDDWSSMPGEIGTFIREQMGVRSTVGSPIFVRGALWGGLFVHSRGERVLPEDTPARLTSFAELVATAVANSQARSELARLADEQAALRRVATLVAHDAPADDVFAAVGEELGRLMWDSPTQIVRFDDDLNGMVLAGWGDAITPANTPISLEGDSVSSLVRRTGAPVRIAASQWTGPLGEYALSFGLKWGVGAPILVDGRVWGAMTIVTRSSEPFPHDTEQRVARFAELVAAAISNIEARADLAASRARVIAAADDERQRVVRDLHDGAQQRLVHTVITLKLALNQLDAGPGRELVKEALTQAEDATDELRDLAHGILPGVLTVGGLRAAANAVADRMTIPVTIDVPSDRLDPGVEATAYFVVSEALTNVAKHSGARTAAITAAVRDDDGEPMLMVSVRDDGLGGARTDGRGLLGLADRLAVLDGRLEVDSPVGGGTTVAAAIPLVPHDPRRR